MRGQLISTRFSIVVALVGAGACAQIEGLSGLKYDRGNGGNGAANGVGGAGGSMTGANGGSSSQEICTNGTDDDGNGLVDCTDPACQKDFACFATPAEWSGPIAFFPNAAPQDTCPQTFVAKVFDGGTMPAGDPLTCSACTCGSEPCGSFTVMEYQDIACEEEVLDVNVPVGSACTAVTPHGPVRSVVVLHEPPVFGGTKCSPQGGGIAIQPKKHFTDRALGCEAPKFGGGCKSGLCLPKVTGGETCIYREGTGAVCPAGWPKANTVFRDLDDQRDCSACACGNPHGCTGDPEVFDDASCTIGGRSISPGGGCVQIAPFASANAMLASPCAPTGGVASGNVEGVSPITVCCE